MDKYIKRSSSGPTQYITLWTLCESFHLLSPCKLHKNWFAWVEINLVTGSWLNSSTFIKEKQCYKGHPQQAQTNTLTSLIYSTSPFPFRSSTRDASSIWPQSASTVCTASRLTTWSGAGKFLSPPPPLLMTHQPQIFETQSLIPPSQLCSPPPVHRFCSQKWDGSNLVLGTMYSYDIFAAMPCCSERLKVSIGKNPFRHS